MNELCRNANCIASIFCLLFPITVFDYTAKMSDKYTFDDWVSPVELVDRDGQRAKKQKLRHYNPNDPNKKYRATYGYHFTCGYIICWISILIYYGS